MARPLSKTLTTTRVEYKTVEVVDGVPQFVDRPDAVFSGILEKERVERMLRGQLGKDAIIVVTNVDSGQHRYGFLWNLSSRDFASLVRRLKNQ